MKPHTEACPASHRHCCQSDRSKGMHSRQLQLTGEWSPSRARPSCGWPAHPAPWSLASSDSMAAMLSSPGAMLVLLTSGRAVVLARVVCTGGQLGRGQGAW